MGKSPISMTIFNSFLYVYQRVNWNLRSKIPSGRSQHGAHHLADVSALAPYMIRRLMWGKETNIPGGIPTPLKHISQLGWFFPIYGKIQHVPNHQPVLFLPFLQPKWSSRTVWNDHPSTFIWQICRNQTFICDSGAKLPHPSWFMFILYHFICFQCFFQAFQHLWEWWQWGDFSPEGLALLSWQDVVGAVVLSFPRHSESWIPCNHGVS